MFEEIKADYIRHGRSLTEPAFVSLLVYRYGRWAILRKRAAARWIANKGYALMRIFILNVTRSGSRRKRRSARISTSSTPRDRCRSIPTR